MMVDNPQEIEIKLSHREAERLLKSMEAIRKLAWFGYKQLMSVPPKDATEIVNGDNPVYIQLEYLLKDCLEQQSKK